MIAIANLSYRQKFGNFYYNIYNLLISLIIKTFVAVKVKMLQV